MFHSSFFLPKCVSYLITFKEQQSFSQQDGFIVTIMNDKSFSNSFISRDYLFLRLVYFFEFVVIPTSTISIDHYPRNHYFQKNIINRLSILQHYSQSLSFALWFL